MEKELRDSCYCKGQTVRVGERWWFRTSEDDTSGVGRIEIEYEGVVKEIEDFPPAQVEFHLDDGRTVWRGNVIEVEKR